MVIILILAIVQCTHRANAADRQNAINDPALETLRPDVNELQYIAGFPKRMANEKSLEFQTRKKRAIKQGMSEEEAIKYVMDKRFECDTNEAFRMVLQHNTSKSTAKPKSLVTPKKAESEPSSSKQAAPIVPTVSKNYDRIKKEWNSQLKSLDLEIPHSRIYRVIEAFVEQHKNVIEGMVLDDVILFETNYPWTAKETKEKKKMKRKEYNKAVEFALDISNQEEQDKQKHEEQELLDAINASHSEKTPKSLFNEEEQQTKEATKASEVSLLQSWGIPEYEATIFVKCSRREMTEECLFQMLDWKTEAEEMLRNKRLLESEWPSVFLFLDKYFKRKEFFPTKEDIMHAVHQISDSPPIDIDMRYDYCVRSGSASSSGL